MLDSNVLRLAVSLEFDSEVEASDPVVDEGAVLDPEAVFRVEPLEGQPVGAVGPNIPSLPRLGGRSAVEQRRDAPVSALLWRADELEHAVCPPLSVFRDGS